MSLMYLLQEAQKKLLELYAVVCCHNNLVLAQLELKAQLRSQLKLERCAAASV